ncbi:MAG TPA: hypothetical protein VK832_10830 [Burkholderiaceae bacterium]|jgi:hypothetical protein|nr:hypothetical protein [Burkholderiaceae bacterium]
MTNPTIVTNLADVRELNAQLCQPTFWEELAGTIAEAESKDIDTAASLMAEFLHDYHGSWPQIERDMDASTICNEMLTKALQIKGNNTVDYRLEGLISSLSGALESTQELSEQIRLQSNFPDTTKGRIRFLVMRAGELFDNLKTVQTKIKQ